jgi:hypothetical protein
MKRRILIALIGLFLLVPGFVMAANLNINDDLLKEVGGTLPDQYTSQSQNPYLLVGRIIRIALSFLGVGAVSFMVYAGFMWMTAAGNDDKVTQAKKTMINAVIGLILITMSYSLTWYLVSSVQRSTNTYGAGTGSGGWELPWEGGD